MKELREKLIETGIITDDKNGKLYIDSFNFEPDELVEIVEQLLLERDKELEQAVLEERNRIAEIVNGMDRYVHTRLMGAEIFKDGQWIRRDELLKALENNER